MLEDKTETDMNFTMKIIANAINDQTKENGLGYEYHCTIIFYAANAWRIAEGSIKIHTTNAEDRSAHDNTH